MSTTLVRAFEITPDRALSLLRSAKRSKDCAAQDRTHAQEYERDAKRLRAAMALFERTGVWFDEQSADATASQSEMNAKIFRQSEQRNRANMIGALMRAMEEV